MMNRSQLNLKLAETKAERDKAQDALNGHKAGIQKLEAKLADHITAVRELERAIAALPKEIVEPRVSDHAVLRFLERRYGFDVEGIRTEMMTDTVKAAILFGARSVKTKDGTLKIAGNTIVTFVGKLMK